MLFLGNVKLCLRRLRNAHIQAAKVFEYGCQGGGLHGTFTWGVIERLLREDNLDIVWISDTGAVNAVALAHGLAHGDAGSCRCNV